MNEEHDCARKGKRRRVERGQNSGGGNQLTHPASVAWARFAPIETMAAPWRVPLIAANPVHQVKQDNQINPNNLINLINRPGTYEVKPCRAKLPINMPA